MWIKRIHFLPVILLLIVIIQLPAYPQPADTPWPMYQGDAKHTGRSMFSGPVFPEIKWKHTERYFTIWYSCPIIGPNGTVYIGTCTPDHELFAFDPDGNIQWRYSTGCNVYSTPAVNSDGTIYLFNASQLHAINPDGTNKWTTKVLTFDNTPSATAIADDGTIYIIANDSFDGSGYLYAVNPDSSNKWRFKTRNNGTATPAIGDDGTIYFPSSGSEGSGTLHAVDPEGDEVWTFDADGEIDSSSPAIGDDGTIYFGTVKGYLYALNPDGTLEWSFTAIDGEPVGTPSIGYNGNIYVKGGNLLFSITPGGTEEWSLDVGDFIKSALTIDADGMIYATSRDHCLYSVTPDGSLNWWFETRDRISSSPTIGEDGTLYLPSEDYNLYALGDTGEPTPQVGLYKSEPGYYYFDDIVEVGYKVNNPWEEYIDLYVALFLNGNLFWYPVWDNSPHPTEIEQGYFKKSIANFQITSSIPPGDYYFYAAITKHGTSDIIGLASIKIPVLL